MAPRPDDVLIIGAGPAGLAAALQLKRYGVEAILIERGQIGGLLNNANLVENYPGFPGGIPGDALVKLFYDQAAGTGVTIRNDEVRSLDYSNECFKADGLNSSYYAPIAMVASGTRGKFPEGLDVPETLKPRILTEITSIKSMVSQRVVIIGAGDLAFDYALNLGRKNTVTILNRSVELKCLRLLWDRARDVSSIEYLEQTQVEEVRSGDKTDVILMANSPKGRFLISCDYLIAAIGREPNLDFLSDNLIKSSSDLERKAVLRFIGDVGNGIFRQASIAVGDGIRNAMEVYKTLEEKRK